MRPDERFIKQSKAFWACVRTLSEWLGYTERGQGRIKVPSIAEIRQGFKDLNLNVSQIVDNKGKPTALGKTLNSYFAYRANVLKNVVEPNLMKLERRSKHFARFTTPRPATVRCR